MSDAKILHLINRLSFGPTPGQIQQVKQQGIEAYITAQLNPNSIAEPPQLTRQIKDLDTLNLNPGQIYRERERLNQEAKQLKLEQKAVQKIQRTWQQTLQQDAEDARLIRAILSPRQLEEVMVNFWYNHFNVFGFQAEHTRLLFSSYEQQAIRPHVLGKFRQLLGATARHPALLFYLDNWLNSAPGSPKAKGRFKGLNENYARELLELHTLGVNGGYTQEDIIALARILTGWGLPHPLGQSPQDEDGFYFEKDRHDFEDKVLLGRTIKGRGIQEGEEALDLLARHPSTAKFIGYKLTQAFVSDKPPASLVEKLAQKFLDTDGEITAVLKTLFQSDEFWNSAVYQAKFKTPYRYLVSAMRAVGKTGNLKRIQGLLRQWGMPLYGCDSPDGYQNTQEAWLNPDAMLRRSNSAVPISNGLLHDKEPINFQKLSNTLGNTFSDQTQKVLKTTPENLRSALILASPDFMKY